MQRRRPRRAKLVRLDVSPFIVGCVLTVLKPAALALEALHKQVLPFLLRRLKEDVLNDLPPKIIQDYHCDLSDLQKQLYDDFSRSQASSEAQDAVRSNNGQKHVFQALQYLRKLCNHPALVLNGMSPEEVKAIVAKHSKEPEPSLDDLEHAPKLQALRCVETQSTLHDDI